MPTPHRLANIALAAILAATLSTAWLLDGPDLATTERDIAADVHAAQAQAQAQAQARTAAAHNPCAATTHCRPAHKRQTAPAAQQVAAQ